MEAARPEKVVVAAAPPPATDDVVGLTGSGVGVFAWLVGEAGGVAPGVVTVAGVEVTAAGVEEAAAPPWAPVIVAPASKVVVPACP